MYRLAILLVAMFLAGCGGAGRKNPSNGESSKASDTAEANDIALLLSKFSVSSRSSSTPVSPVDQFSSGSVAVKCAQISKAMSAYMRQSGDVFPNMAKRANGSSPLSWRVQLLPYFDDPKLQDLYKLFRVDEAWDSPHNKPLVDKMPDVFAGPASLPIGKTSFHVFIGDYLLFRENSAVPVSLAHISDGTRNTLLAVLAGPETATEWTRPGGLAFDVENPLPGLGTLPDNRLWATFVSGDVMNLNAKRLPPDLLSMFIDPRDGFDVSERVAFFAIEEEYRNKKAQMVSQLNQIAKAMNDFSREKGKLPLAGTTEARKGNRLMHSWRVHLLPYLGAADQFAKFKFDENTNTIDNVRAADGGPPEVLQFPTVAVKRIPALHVFVGPGTPFVAEATDSPTKMTAPPEKTLLLIVAPGLCGDVKNGPDWKFGGSDWISGGGIPITSFQGTQPLNPGGKDLRDGDSLVSFGAPILGGFPILMFDGSVRFLRFDISREILVQLINPSDAKTTLDIESVAPLWK